MTPETISKLEEVFALGGTDREACGFAGISTQTLYDYQNRYPEFVERKEFLKEHPVLKARRSVVAAIESDPELALKFLERRRKDEFSLRTETDLTSGGDKVHAINYVVPDNQPSPDA
jgi:hypothetical protein